MATTEHRPSYTSVYETVRTIGRLLAPEDLHYLSEVPQGAESELVIHLSCMAHYTPHLPVLAQKILEKAGHQALIVGGPENCCGELHKHFGDHDLEKQMAKVVMLGFRRVKPRKVVSICPDCSDVFSAHGVSRYPFEHDNISNLFIEYLDRLKAQMQPVNLRVVAHFHTISEARRSDADNMMTLLGAVPGLEILKAQHALGPGNHCQTQRPMPVLDQERMFEEARDLHADALVVPYHSCYRQHCKMQLRYGVPVHHMFNLLAMALGIAFSEPFKELRLLDDVNAVIERLRPRIERFGYDEKVVRSQVQRAIFC
jgi:Fe-S oxidoreductase